METPNQFNPFNSAAMVGGGDKPVKKRTVKPEHLAALPPSLKNKPIILPPKPAKTVTMEQGDGFPKPGDPYWKTHPLITEHTDGTIRQWGEDTTAIKNPNVLPKQMLPPVAVPENKPTKDLSDKAKGYSDYYYRKNQ